LSFFEETNSFDQDVERAVHDAGTDAGFGAAGARCLPGHVQQVAISFCLLCSGVAPRWGAICSFNQSILRTANLDVREKIGQFIDHAAINRFHLALNS
jgi:hypothetical protein